MNTTTKSEAPIPVICVDPSSVAGAEMFNPNSWSGESKGIIQSCWTEYSVLHHCIAQISDMCNDAEHLCAKNIETIQQQWHAAKFELGRVAIFGQQPDMHIRIEAFFSGVKTLLDLLVQLLSTEKIVSSVVDGFHRMKDVYGGRVLNALGNNAQKNKKDAAAKLEAMISEHKKLWIDQVILARNQLIHPKKRNASIDVSSRICRESQRADLCKGTSARNRLQADTSIRARYSETGHSFLVELSRAIARARSV